VLIVKSTGAGALGAVAAQDIILLRGQNRPPFGIGMGYREFRVGRRAHHAAPWLLARAEFNLNRA
jgi:hypothetical protein